MTLVPGSESSHRIRILFVVWRLTRGGGVPVVMRGFLKHFDRDAFEVHVCTIRPIHTEDELERLGDGIRFHPLGLSGRRSFLLRVRALVGVAQVARATAPHIFHVHSGTASYSALAALLQWGRARGVIEVHDAPQSGRLSPANRALERAFARQLGFRGLVHSSEVRSGTASAWNLDPAKIGLVKLGIDVSAFAAPSVDPAITRAELLIPAEAPLVSYVGRLAPQKRPELFLEVARRVADRRPETRFVLVGGGSGLDAARATARRLDLEDHVRIPGFLADPVGIYHASDLFLSTSCYEGFGLAIAEAMAAGVPVVSTFVGGVRDVVGDAGILEPSADPDRLARHVLELLDDPHRRRILASLARQRAREYLDVRRTTAGFEEFYRELLA